MITVTVRAAIWFSPLGGGPLGAGTVSSGQLTRALSTAWPQYAAYAVSFLTIGIMWLNHHTMLAQVTRVDRLLLALNLFLLMGVVAIPFPTALVAEHLTGKFRAGGPVAAVVYGLVMIAISVGYSEESPRDFSARRRPASQVVRRGRWA